MISTTGNNKQPRHYNTTHPPKTTNKQKYETLTKTPYTKTNKQRLKNGNKYTNTVSNAKVIKTDACIWQNCAWIWQNCACIWQNRRVIQLPSNASIKKCNYRPPYYQGVPPGTICTDLYYQTYVLNLYTVFWIPSMEVACICKTGNPGNRLQCILNRNLFKFGRSTGVCQTTFEKQKRPFLAACCEFVLKNTSTPGVAKAKIKNCNKHAQLMSSC